MLRRSFTSCCGGSSRLTVVIPPGSRSSLTDFCDSWAGLPLVLLVLLVLLLLLLLLLLVLLLLVLVLVLVQGVVQGVVQGLVQGLQTPLQTPPPTTLLLRSVLVLVAGTDSRRSCAVS